MKLARKADFPGFWNATWSERTAMERAASRRDPSILWLNLGLGLAAGLGVPLACWLLFALAPRTHLFPWIGLYAAPVMLGTRLFYAAVIVPRIWRALEPREKLAV